MTVTTKPFIIYDDNLIFNTRFAYKREEDTVEVYDPRFFITPYGYYIPTDASTMKTLAFLKDPTNKTILKNMEGFSHKFYLVTIAGDVVHCTINDVTNVKVFSMLVNSGVGVKAIHEYNENHNTTVGSLLFASDSYEEFIKYYDTTYDPNGFTQRVNIKELAKYLVDCGVTLNIESCDLTYFSTDIPKKD